MADLAALDYEIVEVDAASCDDDGDLRDAVIAAFDDWPGDHGRRNWSAFSDMPPEYRRAARNGGLHAPG
ncbi:hypothetical protein LWC34_06665 [Kibdelosporangium philippinense]|uniref:Uncharacterized protein n=1 Tax=Kibdelosporangium philippinense TaxID=211113 RepID=A0ABS8Z3K9_9PSEU|nr:hypothetical protein [Kibdelosporangium philippinense]MCE7002513.1 hypothetical protein [Kibdelosporangium philippinense]